MAVDIRPEASLLYSRPSYPDLFPLAVNRLGRSGRSRGTPTTQARFRATSLILAFDPKRCLQISKELYCLHQSAKLVHANLMPWTVLIDAAVSPSSVCIVTYGLILNLGDWKIAGLAHTIPLMTPDGSPF